MTLTNHSQVYKTSVYSLTGHETVIMLPTPFSAEPLPTNNS